MAHANPLNPENIIRQVFYQSINNKDYTTVRNNFDANVKLNINQYQLSGIDNLLTLLSYFSRVFTSRHAEILSLLAEGDTIFAYWKIVLIIGGKPQFISTKGMTMFKFHRDKIVQINQHWDTSMMDAGVPK